MLLVTDDQRADTVAALGNPHIITPNMDRLVHEGFVFHNAYCMGSMQPAVCMPSRTMLHSGRSLYRLEGVEQRPHLGKSFADAGYATFHIGKRGNTPHPLHKAFAQSRYLDDQAERTGGFSGRTEVDAAIEFLEQQAAEKPFFILIEFAGPHDPRGTNPESRAIYKADDIPLPANYLPFHPFDNGEMLVRDEQLEAWPRTPDAVRRHLHDYYAMITHMDQQLGRLFATLDDRGEWNNTIVVLTSDHGLAIGSHGLFGKQNLYEDGMKPPLIVRGPDVPHGESDAFAYLFDIYPTLCGLTGVPIPDDIDGRDLTPVIQGRVDAVRDTLFLAYRDVQRAVRQGDWKLIHYPQVAVTQLFNLADDPHEMHDLSGDPAQAKRVQTLLALLAEQQAEWGDMQPLSVEHPKPAIVDIETFFPRP
ncbi:MAG: sulfatase-like hydrolase/transferase [Planctomycetaceae bacterium]|nr:sulfatase-like hydrolase/transferase [Planctomycetaceae bacterium]